MNRGLAEGRRRRRGDRGRAIRATLKGLGLFAILGAIAAYGYYVGRGLSDQERQALEREVGRLVNVAADVGAMRITLENRVQELETELAAERARYRRDVPTQVEAEIVRQARRRLDAGVAPARIAAVIGAASRNASPMMVCPAA